MSSSEKTTSPRPRQRRDDAEVGQVARAEQQRALGALEGRQALLEAAVDLHRARDEPRRARARRPSAAPPRPPPRARAGGRRGRGSCSSTAAAPRAPSTVDARALRALDQPRAPAQAARPELVEPRLDRRSRRGEPGYRFGAPSGPRRHGASCAGSAAASRGPTAGSRARRASARSSASRWSSTTSGVSPSSQPERLSGRGLAPLSAWRATFSPRSVEHRAVLLRRRAERRQEVAHHHAVEPGLDGQRLQLAEVLDAPAAEPEQRVREDQAEDRDPLDRLPRVHVVAVAELRARRAG